MNSRRRMGSLRDLIQRGKGHALLDTRTISRLKVEVCDLLRPKKPLTTASGPGILLHLLTTGYGPTAAQNDIRSNVCCRGVKRTRYTHSEFCRS
jgi:hypothetical protein